MSLGNLMAGARVNAKKSQEYVALEIGVARKTIQNWENDVSSPSIDQAIMYFKSLGLSPVPYLFKYVFPDIKDENDEINRIRLIEMINSLPSEGVAQLLNLLNGEHGSSPRAVLNLVSAHLETPMKDRIANASLIVKNYELALKKKDVLNIVYVNKNLIDEALSKAEDAYEDDMKSYIMYDTKNKDN